MIVPMQIPASLPPLPASHPSPAQRELAAVSHPQKDLLVPPIHTRETMDSITRRFEERYEQQVQKGRHVDTHA